MIQSSLTRLSGGRQLASVKREFGARFQALSDELRARDGGTAARLGALEEKMDRLIKLMSGSS